MWLYRSSYSGWREVKHNLFKCPEGYGGPNCYLGGNMRAVISWNCNVTGYYNYRVEAHIWIDYQGTRYGTWVARQTGQSSDPGTVYCVA
jgi:hypothetical protein